MSKHKRSLIFYAILIIILSAGVFLTANNDHWYNATIVRIDHAKNSPTDQYRNGTNDRYYEQLLTGTVKNGPFRGHTASLKNEYSASGVFDEPYQPGDEVFLSAVSSESGTVTGSISGLKRDKYVAALCAAFILFILFIARGRGLLTLLSLSVNIGIFWYSLILYTSGINILLLANLLVFSFTGLSLLLVSGWNQKTFAAICSTLISIAITLLLFKLVMTFTGGVDYAFMEYITSPTDLPEIFMAQIMIGGLGAVMDVAITEASAMSELISKDNEIPLRNLIQSGRDIGHDIMGTMINVMLFTYISGSIPLIILKMNSEIRLHTIILWHMPMELYRFLIGSIGILISIPVSILISLLFFRRIGRIGSIGIIRSIGKIRRFL
ncbi:YibE/F family protein [Anoxybacterium hadale]|uniref:YibE/F family protein n=1 Tax=Anoxybacterium hadale TaxID=3408580 RepID=A0ACD1ABS3_9FIRM|nr:YibE/F family protein [Clostridiales bacterium]